MKPLISLLAMSALLIGSVLSSTDYPDKNTPKNTLYSKIQLALLLDTSNSMDGLIDQAKAKLWNIVNEMTDTEWNGEPVRLEIALYEYGNTNLSARTGWIRQVNAFTTDVDLLSNHLFSLRTRGGDEFCGQVIHRASTDLEWDSDAGFKVVFIAGNESFAQGQLNFKNALRLARTKNIVVNTIYCGDMEEGIRLQWKEGAVQGGGDYFVINQNEEIRYIQTPFDDRISELNEKLNDTYVPIGQHGVQYLQNQRKQDDNAKVYGLENMASRAIYKSKSQYNNANWDLIDAYEKSKDVIEDTDNLPESYRSMTRQQIKKEIERLKQSRLHIKNEIQSLAKKRKEHIEIKASDVENGLEASMIQSLKSQMQKRQSTSSSSVLPPSNIDYPGFAKLTREVEDYRQERLVNLDDFLMMAEDANTILLDTRSERAYHEKHLKGAIHLNFSDFSDKKLEAVIPSKDTRILIYCNNNMLGDPARFFAKSAPLALNIPTFINLYGYGYKNVYELKNNVDVSDARLQFDSTFMDYN